MSERGMSTYETTQPWVIWNYGLTHDKWWPLWTSTRVLGFARIAAECMVCGDRTIIRFRIPRVGSIDGPPGGGTRHPLRERYLAAHLHPDRGHPMSWAKPLANMAAHNGLDLDLLALRLEADIRDNQTARTEDGEA